MRCTNVNRSHAFLIHSDVEIAFGWRRCDISATFYLYDKSINRLVLAGKRRQTGFHSAMRRESTWTSASISCAGSRKRRRLKPSRVSVRRARWPNKEKGSFDPVTEADREAERAIRALIAAEYPDHGILGEEHGSENISSEMCLGDRSDRRHPRLHLRPAGVGDIVGLTVDGDAVAGMMAQPFTGELFYANASGSHYEGPGRTAEAVDPQDDEARRGDPCSPPRRRCSRARRATAPTGSKKRCSSFATAPIAMPSP